MIQSLLGRSREIFDQTRLIHKIIEELKGKIIRGELKEGEKLSSQDKFAKAMGVSRGTLREALNQLVMMGIIEMKHGSGTYVRSLTPSSFMNSLSPALVMNKTSAIELLDARLCIEGALASLAARKATKDDIQELRKIIETMKRNLESGNIESFQDKDLEFHELIAKCSKNRVLIKVIETIREILYQFIADFFKIMPNTQKIAMDYHVRIFKAIEDRNAQEAKKQMEAHIRSLIRMVNQLERNRSSVAAQISK